MKKSKFTTEQIIFALRHADAGLGVDETCRKLGISQATFSRWKQKFGAMGPRRSDTFGSSRRRIKSSSSG